MEFEVRALAALRLGADQEQVVKEMLYKLTNRLTLRTDQIAAAGRPRESDAERLHILRDGFGLDTH